MDNDTLEKLVDIAKHMTDTGNDVEGVTKGILERGLDTLARRHRKQNPQLGDHEAHVEALNSPAGKALYSAYVLAKPDREPEPEKVEPSKADKRFTEVESRATDLRKRDPSLTKAQAIAKSLTADDYDAYLAAQHDK